MSANVLPPNRAYVPKPAKNGMRHREPLQPLLQAFRYIIEETQNVFVAGTLCAQCIHCTAMFLRREQDHLRADNYKDLRETIANPDGDSKNLGQKVILPATFCGSTRFTFERQQDAMAYVRKFGRPDLFITVTTNREWPEILDSSPMTAPNYL